MLPIIVLLILIGLPPTSRSALAEPHPLPASGQQKAYKAERDKARGDGPVAVPDDGSVRAGVPLRYRDNGNGTITDLNTGLMWEKKCNGCGGPHDWDLESYWSGDGVVETIWDWIDQLNAQASGKTDTSSEPESSKGFAGHDDWRVPNVKELLSIVDYSRFDPAVAATFHHSSCNAPCKDLTSDTCSCTSAALYWTSTTFSDFPAHALVVDMGYGLVDDRVKTSRHHVRAVRSTGVLPKKEPAQPAKSRQ